MPIGVFQNIFLLILESISIYPISKEGYLAAAEKDFKENILPLMAKWLEEVLTEPETKILGYKQLIIEWTGKEYRKYQIVFL